MRIKTLLILVLFSCSTSEELSSGDFNIYSSKSFERVEIKPIIKLSKSLYKEGEPITGKLFFDDDSMLRNVASELGLNYTKTFYYYAMGSFSNRVKIGEGGDTLNFNFTTVKPDKSEGDLLANYLGAEALGIRVSLKNKTHSYDSTFMQFFDIPWN